MNSVVNGIKLQMQIFIFSIITQEILGGSFKYFHVGPNNVRFEHVYHATLTSSKLACCAKCGRDVNCLSVNYQISTGTCEFSPLPWTARGTNSFADPGWTTMSKAIEWFLLFLGVAGNGVDTYEAWINGTGVTTDDVNCMKHNFTSCSGQHYRNKAVDVWNTFGIKEVKYSLYKNNQEVAFLTFDGKGHTFDSWFTYGGMIASSWTDIPSGSLDDFSMEGWRQGRRFYIFLTPRTGCPSDKIYTLTVTRNVVWCSYDDQDSYPQFLYSNTSSYGYPEDMIDFDKADAITIHIKTWWMDNLVNKIVN